MRLTKLSIPVMCIVLMLCAVAIAPAQDAPEAVYSYMAGFDSGRSGVSPESLEVPLVLSWANRPEIKGSFTTVGSAVVGPDKVYFPAHQTMYAVDRNTGELAWQLSVGQSIYSTPLLHDGVLYFGAEDNMLWAVDARNGHRLWQFPTGGPVRSAPLYVSGVLYFGSDDGRLYALDVNSRSLVVSPFQTRGRIRTAPCYYRDNIFVASDDGHLYAIDARSGQQAWRSHLGTEIMFSSPIIERGKVILGVGNQLIAYDTTRGARRWTFTSGGLISGAPATASRRVYVGSRDGVVYCLDSNNGQVIWRFPTDGVRRPVSSPVTIAGDKLFVRFGKINLAALSLDRGALVWEYKLPEPLAMERVGQPGHGPVEGLPDAFPDMGPGGPGMMDVPDDMGAGPGRPRTRDVTRISFEEVMNPGLSLSADSAFIVSADGALYGFFARAADNVKPQINDALLDVRGRGGIQVRFPLLVDQGDTFPGRYADLVQVPGAPPISFSVSVVDTGAGINPDSLTMEMDGQLLPTTYDAQQGLLWYTYDPRGAAVSLPNGVRNIVISATDWVGNVATAQVSFTVDNSLEPPGPPERPVGPEMDPHMDPHMDIPPPPM